MPTERPKIYLSKVHIKGFKSIEDLTVDFQKDLNILIGKNGSGKSNFFEAVYRLLRERNLGFYSYAKVQFVSSDDHLFWLELHKISQNINLKEEDGEDRVNIVERFSVDNKIVFDSIEATDHRDRFMFNNKLRSYGKGSTLRSIFVRFGYAAISPLYVKYALPDFLQLQCLSVPGTFKIHIEDDFSMWEYPTTIGSLTRILNNIEIVHDDSIKQIKAINKSNFYKRLEFGEELLNNLKRYSNIQEIKFNNNLNVYHDDKSVIIENIKVDFKVNGNWLPWSQLSDGTQRLFYIIAEITDSNGPIFIEEPELGVHPHQFNLLMDFLKEQSQKKQIIISSHSPKALDHLSPDELNDILIASYDKKEGTSIRHLTNKEINKAKKYMKEVGFFSDYWMLSDLE
ncbi:MAG TPA: AAA family ATPase [Mucilaginibacter sp.]